MSGPPPTASLGAAPPVTVLDAIVAASRAAGSYNRHDQERPAAILWPDRERQWAPLLSRLRGLLPILTLGPYDPATRTGPAAWLRYALSIGEVDAREGVPIIYLPGFARTDLRAVEECDQALKPIVDLQYRGVIFSHRNGRDWTVAGLLGSTDPGPGIEIVNDAATREALAHALTRFVDEPLARLRREMPLRAERFTALLHPDEARSLLEWLDDPELFRATRTPEQWQAFRTLARQQYDLDPERDGVIAGAAKLGGRQGRWGTVWTRFTEAPGRYQQAPERLRQARGPQRGLFDGREEAWPQDNEAAEEALRQALSQLANEPPIAARERIVALAAEHGDRRGWVWAELGQAPLAKALAHLRELAAGTATGPGGQTMTEIAAAYAGGGWRTDAAMLAALREIETEQDAAAVGAAIRAVYRPWLEAGATAFQQAARRGPEQSPAPGGYAAGTCLVFVDGLRLDTAHHLAALLTARGALGTLGWRFGALPGVTPTAKPAVSPVAARLQAGADFTVTAPSAKTSLTAEGLRKLIAEAGWEVLTGDETGDPTGRGWTESGLIDQYGHGDGWRLAWRLPETLREVSRRVRQLLAAGWRRVEIVTDHGWLLLPGGLPTSSLAEHLTVRRKGRCARLKPDATTEEQIVPWHWDPSVRIAVARGITCYEAGKEYEHGGLSPQECVLPVLTVTAGIAAEPVTISKVTWRGLRCEVTVAGDPAGLLVDLRTNAGDAGSSLATALRAIGGAGSASVIVEDEDRLGDAAHVVIIDDDDRLLAQQVTTVGG